MPYHMSSAPPSEGATCSPWPFEKPWGLHVCPTPCPRRPHCSGATCSSWPFGKPWGLSFFTHVLSASCLARADPHTTARALGSSPSCSPHSSQGPRESSSDEHFQGRHACSLTPGAASSRPTRACPCLPSVRAPRHCGAMPPFSRSFGRPLALWASRGTPGRPPRSVEKITSLRCEVHLLRAAFAAAPFLASAAVSAVPPPPEGNPSGVTLPYVRATRAHAPIHVKCPIQDGRTKCGWKWSSCPHITELLQPIHVQDDSSDHMTPMCSRCRDALSASDSSASSSEGPGTLSSTCGVSSAPSRHDGPAGKAPGGAPAAA